MLVITRRIGEEILIAGSIRVRVVTVRGKQVRLGVSAPSSVRVVREELLAEYSQDLGAMTTGSLAIPAAVEL
jgi:carbon storage regulator